MKHIILLAALAILLNGQGLFRPDFADTDAAVHAMDGVFIHDLIRDMPAPSHWKQYAIEYYARHPALGLIIYPPLLSVVLAPFYFIFGISAPVARGVILLFSIANILVFFHMLKSVVDRNSAFLASVFLLTNLEVLEASRDVMLEIPALFFMNAATFALLRSRSFSSAVLLAAAFYAKQTAGFLIAPLFLLRRDPKLLFFFLLIAPLLFVTVQYGSYGTVQLSPATYGLAPSTFAYWAEWAHKLGAVINPFVLVLAGAGAVVSIRRHHSFTLLMVLWFISWYLVFSYLPIKTLRFAVFAVPPIAALAGLAFSASQKMIRAGLGLLGGALVVVALMKPVPVVEGYQEAAAYAATLGERPLLFDGHQSGNFIFHMRRVAENRIVLRGSKMITSTASGALKNYPMIQSPRELAEMLDRYGVEHIIVEKNPESILLHTQWLRTFLASGMFENVKEFNGVSIYRYKDAKKITENQILEIFVPSAGMTISVPLRSGGR